MSSWQRELERLGIRGETIAAPDRSSVVYGADMPATAEFIEDARRVGWLEADTENFDALDNGLFLDKGSKLIYRQVPGNPLLGADPANAVSVFFVSGDAMICLRTAEPYTLAALEARNDQAQAAQARSETDAAEERAKFLDRQPKREVLLGDVKGRPLPSVREAARILLVDYRAELRARDGRVSVRIPQQLSSPGWDAGAQQAQAVERAADATLVLVAAREVVLEALAAGGRKGLDLTLLPDRQVTADCLIA